MHLLRGGTPAGDELGCGNRYKGVVRHPLRHCVALVLLAALGGCRGNERPEPRKVDRQASDGEPERPSESPRPEGKAPSDRAEPVLALIRGLPEVPEGVSVVVEGQDTAAILPELESPRLGATRLFVSEDRIDAMWRFAGLSQQGGPMPVGAEVFSSFALDGSAVATWRHYPCNSIIEAQTGEIRSPPGVADVSDKPPEVFEQTSDPELAQAASDRLAAWGQGEFSLEGVLGAGYLLHDMGSGRQVQSQRDAEATLADAFSAFGDKPAFEAVDHRVHGTYTVTRATAVGEGHTLAFVAVHRFDAGKLVESWLYLDRAVLPKPDAVPSDPQIAHPPFRGE